MFGVPTICHPSGCPTPCGGVGEVDTPRRFSLHDEETTGLEDAQPVGQSTSPTKRAAFQDPSESSPKMTGTRATAAFSTLARNALEAGKKAASSKQDEANPSASSSPKPRLSRAKSRRAPIVFIHLKPPRLGARGSKAVGVLRELVQEALAKKADEDRQNLAAAAPSAPAQSQTAQQEGIEDDEDWKPPTWQMEEAFSQDLGRVVVKAFKEALNLQDADEPIALRHLGTIEPGQLNGLLKEMLISGDCASKLSETLGQQLGNIAQAEALTGDEMNAKFAMCPDDKFEMVFGDKATYLKGLEPRIGLPSAKTLQAIVEEHCRAEDSALPWTTGNYGITTTSREELLIVLKTLFEEFETLKQQRQQTQQQLQNSQQQQRHRGRQQQQQQQQQQQPHRPQQPGQGPIDIEVANGNEVEEDFWKPIEASIEELRGLVKDFDLRSIEWKDETKNDDFPRATYRSKNLLLALAKKNRQLRAMDRKQPLLRLEEALLCNLYTGPLFEKYNQVHRGGSLTGDNNQRMEQRFQELCRGNRYTTSQFVLTSGMIKLSVLSKAVDLYRGVGKGLLPKQFWRPNAFGSRGGVELGFMSATTDRDVACQYASGSTIQTVFELETGMIDNGAELDWISQYPHEKEICFPPLTALEVVKTRCEGSLLCVSLRLNLNLTNDTIEEVVGRRKQVVRSLCNGLEQEVKHSLAGRSSLWPNLFRSISPQVLPEELAKMKEISLKTCKQKLTGLQDHDPEYYNDDTSFVDIVQQGLNYASSAKCCGGKVLLEIAEALDKEQAGLQLTWKERLTTMAGYLLEDDFEAKHLQTEATYEGLWFPGGSNIKWVFKALGFERWQGLWVEAGPDFVWRDGGQKTRQPLPRSAGRPLPRGCWLMELEGSRDLDQAARKLRKDWKASNSDYRQPRKLSARFAVALPREQKELRDWWHQSSRAGPLEAGAVRLQRIWTMAPPNSFDEEWLPTKLLDDEGAKAWLAAFWDASAAGIFPAIPGELRLSESCVPRNSGPDLWSVLVSSSQLKVLDLSRCLLTASFAKSLETALSNFARVGQNPFQDLQELKLSSSPDLGKDLAEPESFMTILGLCSCLQALHLDECGFDSSFAMALASLMLAPSPWPKLQTLRLYKNPGLGIDLRDPSPFVQGLVALPALEDLRLNDCGLESTFAMALGAAILEKVVGTTGGRCCRPKLKTLWLCENPGLGADLREPSAFARGLASFCALEDLRLNDCGLGSSFVVAFGAAILEKHTGTNRGGQCCLPRMKSLWLHQNPRLGADLRDPSTFAKSLTALHALKDLRLNGCGLESSFPMALGSAILECGGSACLPKMKTLWLHENPLLGAELLEPSTFAKSLIALPALEDLRLKECGLESSFAMAFGSAILEKPTNEGDWHPPIFDTLWLHQNPRLGAELVEPTTFAKSLAELPAVRDLRLADCGLESSFAMALGSEIVKEENTTNGQQRAWPKLEKLWLGHNNLGADLHVFVDGLVVLPELQALALDSCGLDDDFANTFLAKLSSSNDCEVGNQEQQEQPVCLLPKLESLWLSENFFSDQTASAVVNWFGKERLGLAPQDELSTKQWKPSDKVVKTDRKSLCARWCSAALGHRG